MSPFLRRAILAAVDRAVAGQLIVREGGRTHVLGAGGPQQATIELHSPQAWWALVGGVKRTADAYCDRLWDSPDLTALFRLAAQGVADLDPIRRRAAILTRLPQMVRKGVLRNTRSQSRRDIQTHYDAGNDFFAEVLDPTMTYSCAVFADECSSLEAAQIRKLEMICQKLDLGPEDRVVEIGTGWGHFAIYAASTRGCRVTTTTISQAQYDLAVARVEAAGLEDLVQVRMDDYRDLRGQYDKLVSVEMIEAVGHRNFGRFFDCCSRLLVPTGAMLVQAITIDDGAYEVSRRSRSFVTTYVFPNGCLPSKRVLDEAVERHSDLRVAHVEDLTAHYPRTLQAWQANLASSAARLCELHYDERHRRFWHLYLCYAEAGFAEGRTAVQQTVLTKPDHADRVGPEARYVAAS